MTNNLTQIENELIINDSIRDEVDAFIAKASSVDMAELKHVTEEAKVNCRIPKIIHFCFVNYNEIPDIYYLFFKRWIDTLDGYLFVNWTPNNLPMNPYAEMCLRDKKWAFYADYARLYAVFNYGGFYMDADIWTYKPFDDLLDFPYVFEIEHSCLTTIDKRPRLEAGMFGARSENPLIGLLLAIYDNLEMVDNVNYSASIAPFLWASVAQQCGFVIQYCYGNAVDLDAFFRENRDIYKIATLDGTYFSKTETDLPNRFLLGEQSGITEQHHESHAYASHQFLSNWCN